MKCNLIRLSLPDYVRGRMPEGEKAAIEQHLATCTACREEEKEFRELFVTLGAEQGWKPSSAYFSGILPRVHNRIERKSRELLPAWIGKWAMPLASVAVLAVFMLKIVPDVMENRNLAASATLEQMPTDDLSEYIERQAVVGVMEPTGAASVSAAALDLGEDRSVLKSILKVEKADYSVYTSESETLDDVLTDRDANDIIPILEKDYSHSGE
ncbi:MAG TPA: zf-HC2 domain-containing protein [Bacteroidota bacterium]|nr:zf-HC2 domain-containing protein [Bacteroidota bacterium]